MVTKIDVQNKAEVRQVRQRQETYIMRKEQSEFEKKMAEKYNKLLKRIEELEAK